MEGQQYNLETDDLLYDFLGNPLIFTRDVKIFESGSNLHRAGIRPQKYAIDYANLAGPFNSPVDNDWVYLRFPDVLLMKAEAILRGGAATNGTSALELVNMIRTHPSRGASTLSALDLNGLLEERGRELWLNDGGVKTSSGLVSSWNHFTKKIIPAIPNIYCFQSLINSLV